MLGIYTKDGKETMKILKPHDRYGWITAEIAGRWVQAKVYDAPSTYGVRNGRVSNLAIGKTQDRAPNKPFFPQMAYNYSRGLDFDNLPIGVLDAVLAELEALPPCMSNSTNDR